MEAWISVKDRLPPLGTGEVLIVFLEPFFGEYTQEVAVAYYDDPDDYHNPGDENGWRFWMPLPTLPTFEEPSK